MDNIIDDLEGEYVYIPKEPDLGLNSAPPPSLVTIPELDDLTPNPPPLTTEGEKELWKPIPGFAKRFECSTLGRIKTNSFNKTKILEPDIEKFRTRNAYLTVCITDDDNKKITARVHRLVAKTWLPNPEDLPEVNHKDKDIYNNKLSNLEWCSRQENQVHAMQDALNMNGNPRPIYQMDMSGDVIKEWNSAREASQTLGIHDGDIARVCGGKRTHAGGFKWKYAEENISAADKKEIPGFPGYYATRDGRITGRNGRVMKPAMDGGYYKINMTLPSGRFKASVHRLVALTYLPNPDNKPLVDHINTDTLDNRVENLRWVTQKDNMNNTVTLGKMRKKVYQYNLDGTLAAVYNGQQEAATAYGCDKSNISLYIAGKTKCKDYKWSYDPPKDSLDETSNSITEETVD